MGEPLSHFSPFPSPPIFAKCRWKIKRAKIKFRGELWRAHSSIPPLFFLLALFSSALHYQNAWEKLMRLKKETMKFKTRIQLKLNICMSYCSSWRFLKLLCMKCTLSPTVNSMKSERQSAQSKTTHLALPEHFWQNSVSFWALLHWRGVFDAGTTYEQKYFKSFLQSNGKRKKRTKKGLLQNSTSF